MLENVRLISKVNKVERREALIKILKKNDLKYKIQHEKLRNHFVDNIIVTFNSEIRVPKLVIGAHYDNIEGSCGANDNASGISILIEVAKYLKLKRANRPIELVFFDREEYEDRGSEQYIISTGRENIYAMINIDTCGFGDMMLIGPEKNLGVMKEKKIISEGLLHKEYIEIIKRTPGSDDRSFEAENITNISIGVVTKGDVEIIQKIIKLELENKFPTKDLIPNPPEFMSTVHNGDRDCIEIVEESSMKIVLDFIINILEELGI
ncbi:M28 family peptidase [Clostridium perfringens]|uniref:M28 family metallopeptidase n=1 Tax=Clostridium perfringens TaxID=1502 RepID=UPI0024BCFA8B|nr:M28 family peptidase [Clostridium perfringens]